MNFLGFGHRVGSSAQPISRSGSRIQIVHDIDVHQEEPPGSSRFNLGRDFGGPPIGITHREVAWRSDRSREARRQSSVSRSSEDSGRAPKRVSLADQCFQSLCESFDDFLEFLNLVCCGRARLDYEMANEAFLAMRRAIEAIDSDPAIIEKAARKRALTNDFVKVRTALALEKMDLLQREELITRILVRDFREDIDQMLSPLIELLVSRENKRIKGSFESGLTSSQCREMENILRNGDSRFGHHDLVNKVSEFVSRNASPLIYIHQVKNAIADYAAGVDLDRSSLVMPRAKNHYGSLRKFYTSGIFEEYQEIANRHDFVPWVRNRLLYLESDLFIKMVSQPMVNEISVALESLSPGVKVSRDGKDGNENEELLKRLAKTPIISDLVELTKGGLTVGDVDIVVRSIDAKCKRLTSELRELDFDVVHYIGRYWSSVADVLFRSSVIKQMLALLKPDDSFEILSKLSYQKLLLLASAPIRFRGGHEMIDETDLEKVELQIRVHIGMAEITIRNQVLNNNTASGLDNVLLSLREGINTATVYLVETVIQDRALRIPGAQEANALQWFNDLMLKNRVRLTIEDIALYVNVYMTIMNTKNRFEEPAEQPKQVELEDVVRDVINPLLEEARWSIREESRGAAILSNVAAWFRLCFPAFCRS